MNELKLALLLLLDEKELPSELKEKALNQLKVFSMAQEAGSAEAYLADQLLKAIDEEDAEAAEHIGDMANLLYGFDGNPFDGDDHRDDGERLEPTDEIADAIKQCCEDYVREVDDPMLQAARTAVIERLHDEHDLIPLVYDNGMLVGFNQRHRLIMVYFINQPTISKDEVVSRYDGTIDNDKIVRIIMDQWDIKDGAIKVEFLHLDVKILGKGKLRIMTRPV